MEQGGYFGRQLASAPPLPKADGIGEVARTYFIGEKINIANTGPVQMMPASMYSACPALSVRTEINECAECVLTSLDALELQSHG